MSRSRHKLPICATLLGAALLLPAMAGAVPASHRVSRGAQQPSPRLAAGPFQLPPALLRSLRPADQLPLGQMPPGTSPAGPAQGSTHEGAGLDPHGVPRP